MSWLCPQTSAVLQPRLFSVTPSTSQILFLSGLTFIIGLRRTAHFFFQRHKFRGSFFFLGGVSLVLCRWPIIGMLVESYGFVLLFRWCGEDTVGNPGLCRLQSKTNVFCFRPQVLLPHGRGIRLVSSKHPLPQHSEFEVYIHVCITEEDDITGRSENQTNVFSLFCFFLSISPAAPPWSEQKKVISEEQQIFIWLKTLKNKLFFTMPCIFYSFKSQQQQNNGMKMVLTD